MSNYRVLAMPEAIAAAVRSTRISPFSSHPTFADVARGYGPCRLCLRTFQVGKERRILLTYDPFAGREDLPLPGPVFIHEEACVRFPEDGGFPDGLRAHTLTLNAYGRGRRLHAQEYVADGRVEPVIERLLARPEVDYIHVRDTNAGCYDLCIERVVGRGV